MTPIPAHTPDESTEEDLDGVEELAVYASTVVLKCMVTCVDGVAICNFCKHLTFSNHGCTRNEENEKTYEKHRPDYSKD